MIPTKLPTPTAIPPKPEDMLTPERVCELLGLPGPHAPTKAPPPWPGYWTFWDPGRSLKELKRLQPTLFLSWLDWSDNLPFAKQTDSSRWRQMRLEPIQLGEPFAEQTKVVPKGDTLPLAREVVTFALLRFLATGERLAYRLRCRELLHSGRRVLVGPLRDTGLDLANCADDYCSPLIGLASANGPG